MKQIKSMSLWTVIVASAALAACSASAPTRDDSKPGVVFASPVATVRNAAVAALETNGFVVGKTEPLYVEGTRPSQSDKVVGPGGESAGIWLTAVGATRTEVKVGTSKSLVGTVTGQRTFDIDILAQMQKTLGEPGTSK